MPDTILHRKLTHECAMKMLHEGIKKANDMGVPQCIHIVDDGGHLLAFIRMDGGKILSTDSSFKKALTAASSRVPTGDVPSDVDLKLAIATEGAHKTIWVTALYCGTIQVLRGLFNDGRQMSRAERRLASQGWSI